MNKSIKRFFEKNHVLSRILPIALILVLAIIGYFSFSSSKVKNLSEAEAKTKSEEFINAYLMADGSKASIVEITEEYGLYKLKVDITSSIVESYLTKDGKLFFPQALNIEEILNPTATTGGQAQAPISEVSVKSDKPAIELFVMSHCPFGTQMEKGILPVIEALGNTVDFKIKFNSYAMHGENELKEQTAQYCMMTEQPKVFNAYLKCFLASGESDSCLSEAKVDTKSLDSCVTKTDGQYKIMDNFKNKVGYQGTYPGFDIFKADNEKYGVGGSPTLIINGQEISSERDSASLLKTICTAFNNAPSACSANLSSETPAPGFGTGTAAASNSAAACN